MIGRFSRLGVYRELVDSEEFFRVAMAGGLALASYLWDTWKGPGTLPGSVMVLASVSLSGLPILLGAVTGLLRRQVNVDELVSLAIIACLIQGEFLTAAVVSLIMMIGSLIEKATCEAARKAVRWLMSLSPGIATVIVQGQAVTRPVRSGWVISSW